MRTFILGTDWWTDCDDAVALRLLTRFVKDKRIQLLGIGINGCMPYSVASLKGFLLADGVDHIPIGIDPDAIDFGGNPPYQKRLAEDFAPHVTNQDAEDAVRLYRRLLSGLEQKTEILEIGYLQVFAAVLNSPPDDISDKTGLELVRDKVSKVWAMAGKWDADGERENNFCRNARSRVAGQAFCERCPVPVTFLGWEVGYNVITGTHLEKGDHLYRALVDHGSPKGRSSWDPMLVLMALIGDETAAGYQTVRGWASVDSDTGANHFVVDPQGMHQYVIKTQANEYYAEQIHQYLNLS